MTDIAYVVGDGEENSELRFSLRSLENIPHGNVFIFGFKPWWVTNVIHMPIDQGESPQENVNRSIIRMAHNHKLSERFLFMNDDFYIMSAMKYVPSWYQGPLQDRIDTYKANNNHIQAFTLVGTQRELERLGYNNLKSWELHTPMYFEKAKLRDMFAKLEVEPFAIRPRSLYANIYKLKGEQHADVKEISEKDSQLLSSSEPFDKSRCRDRVIEAFGQPGRYELDSSFSSR